MRDGFDLGRLGEHVEWSDRDDGEGLLQFGEIPREGGGIAGDVDHRVRRRIENDAA